jgi:hypothetical protein
MMAAFVVLIGVLLYLLRGNRMSESFAQLRARATIARATIARTARAKQLGITPGNTRNRWAKFNASPFTPPTSISFRGQIPHYGPGQGVIGQPKKLGHYNRYTRAAVGGVYDVSGPIHINHTPQRTNWRNADAWYRGNRGNFAPVRPTAGRPNAPYGMQYEGIR